MSAKIPFIDVQGLAGAWSLGTVKTGEFDLVARRSLPGGFGDAAMDANRSLVGDGWEQQTGIEPEWEPGQAGYVCGTPPCSGFSLLNTTKGDNARGKDSAINNCMKDLISYAGKCTGLDDTRGPEVVAFESVQGAYRDGRPLMSYLRESLSEATGQEYHLTHVKMSGSAVGSAQMRHRYYPVFHRIPFHVENPKLEDIVGGKVVTYRDAIGDLEGLVLQREDQPYGDTTSKWALAHQRRDGLVNEHLAPTGGGAFIKLVDQLAPHWPAGERIDVAVRNFGRKPDVVKDKKFLGFEDENGNPRKQVLDGWSWPTRLHPDRPGYVLTGAGIMTFVHYSEDRMLTIRECSRLMGYPDDWRWDFAKSPMGASMLIGKCCPVESGKWISGWVAKAIRNQYDGPTNSEISSGDVKPLDEPHESLHDSTNIYKPWLKEQLAAS